MTVRLLEVLDFWFGNPADSTSDDANTSRWFKRDDDFDAHIRQHFGSTVVAARAGELDAWAHTPRGWLALLIVLDQFPRNMYRDSAQAFASDVQAQRLVLDGLVRGDARELQPIERVFCYVPLEHAEDAGLQQRNVELFTALRDRVDEAQGERFSIFLECARRHQMVIERFGRFPHRNHVLGRVSTDAEQAYLAQPDAGF